MSNFELNLLKAIGHHIPRFPHSAAIYNRILKPFYNRKKENLSYQMYTGSSLS